MRPGWEVALRLILAGIAVGFSGPLSLQAQSVPPPMQVPQTAQQAAQVPPRNQIAQGHLYPKNLAQQLLGARIRVNQTAGLRTINGFPPPATTAGTLDISSLLSESFDGLELAPGFHSFTITLAKPLPVNRVSFVNMEATGTFNVLIGVADPMLQATPPTKEESALAGPSMVNYAVFQPQMARFIQIEFRIVRPGRVARLGVYGLASALDFAVHVASDGPSPAAASGGSAAPGSVHAPGGTPSLPPTKEVAVDMANMASGTRISRVSSGSKGADPNQMISDSLGGSYTFNAADPSPTLDLDFKNKRKVSDASIVLAGPPCRVELIKSSAPPPPPPSSGIATVKTASGVVEMVSFDGSGQTTVKPGDVLLPGRVLRTGFNSSAELDIDGKSLLRVGPNSNVTLRIGTANGAEVSVLRGTVLWQVYAPGGGGRLITPTSIATILGTTVIADVKINGGSSISLLETSRTDGVQVSSVTTGERYTLHPGEVVSVGGVVGGGGEGLSVKPFVIQKAWDQSTVGASAGPLRNNIDQVFVPGGVVPTPQDEGEVLATTTTKGGLSEAKLNFNGQSLDGVRVRITPLPGAASDTPITVVSVGVSGQYQVQDLDYAYQGKSVAVLAANEGVTNPSSSAAPGAAGAQAQTATAQTQTTKTTQTTTTTTQTTPGKQATTTTANGTTSGAASSSAASGAGAATGAGPLASSTSGGSFAAPPASLAGGSDASAAATSASADSSGNITVAEAADNAAAAPASAPDTEVVARATEVAPPSYYESYDLFQGADALSQLLNLPTNTTRTVSPQSP